MPRTLCARSEQMIMTDSQDPNPEEPDLTEGEEPDLAEGEEQFLLK